MFRKSILALAGVAALSAAALAPTSASAWGFKGGWGHHHWHGGWGFYPSYGVSYVDVVPSCYYVKKINRFGQVRMIKVCE